VVSWQWSGMLAAVVRRRCFSAGFIWEHLDEASMPIEWIKSIKERFDSRPKVQVLQGHQVLAGRIGTIMKVGFDGDIMFYELLIPGLKGKKVVSSKLCRSIFNFDLGGEGLSSTEDRRGQHVQQIEVAKGVGKNNSTFKESGQGSSAGGGNGDMSTSALRQVTLRSSKHDCVPQGNGEADDSEVRLQSLRSSSLEDKRKLACKLLATECAQRQVSPDNPRQHMAYFEDVFKGLQFEEFMRLLITCMQTLDKSLYIKKVCCRVLNEAWAAELVCGIKLGEWASGKKKLVLDGLSDASINIFRDYTKILANKVCEYDRKNLSGNEDAGSPKSVCDMSICI